jgi:uncharacterized protein YceK
MKRVVVCAMLATSALSGCGTLGSCTNEKKEEYLRPYGGVTADLRIMKDDIAEYGEELYPGLPVRPFAPLEIAICACDLPLSAVADTVMLPITIPCSIGRAIVQADTTPKDYQPKHPPDKANPPDSVKGNLAP